VTKTVAIAGASIAGVRTAQALRTEGFDGRIVLVGAEHDMPYDKPPLSKQVLSGEWTPGRSMLLTQEAADAAGIELSLGAAAEHLDTAGRRLVLTDGRELSYDACVVATGAAARPCPWKAGSGIHVVRSLQDGLGLREDLLRGGHVVIVGGGFIGAESAATARQLGCAVTIVDPAPVPMARILGPEVGRHFVALHQRHDVTTRFGTGVASVEGEAGDLRVELTDGTVLSANTVIVGIGAVLNDQWLASSGLRLEDGVVCDEFCRADGADDVFAVGDIARWFHSGHGESVRVEHWTNAVEQAACVAYNITHPDAMKPYSPVEYVWSDQYDWKIQIVGRPARATHQTTIGDLASDSARAAVLYTDDTGVLSAAVTVNWPRALIECRRQVIANAPFATAAARIAALAARPSHTAGAAS
jgi:phthalate 3,4-dioxygenase ferredoxin reductase subunit